MTELLLRMTETLFTVRGNCQIIPKVGRVWGSNIGNSSYFYTNFDGNSGRRHDKGRIA